MDGNSEKMNHNRHTDLQPVSTTMKIREKERARNAAVMKSVNHGLNIFVSVLHYSSIMSHFWPTDKGKLQKCVYIF
jgi:hypothetical protein